jgi:hypothetical protein
MPLLDHFHPPLHPRRHWESFPSNWATRLADALNDRWLPPEFLAEETTHAGGHLEIDVATYQQTLAPAAALPTGGPPGRCGGPHLRTAGAIRGNGQSSDLPIEFNARTNCRRREGRVL